MTDTAKIKLIFESLEETIAAAEIGARDMRVDVIDRRSAAIRNVVVYGRAVTNVLQKLRSQFGEDFESWYCPYVEEMQSDPVMRFLYKIRSEVLKEGFLVVLPSITITGKNASFSAITQSVPKPLDKNDFMLGGKYGATGWTKKTETGFETDHVDISGSIGEMNVDVDIHFASAPEEIARMSAYDICENYVSYLRNMVEDAKSRFLHK